MDAALLASDVKLPAPVEGVGFNTLCTDEKAIGIRTTLTYANIFSEQGFEH